MNGSGMEMIRKKVLEEWSYCPYFYQKFNKDESSNWRIPISCDETSQLQRLDSFLKNCEQYQSFKFSIDTQIVGGVKLCSYYELQQITDFKDKNSFIRTTLAGRLFRGTICEGSDKRTAIVKTWDFLLPYRDGHIFRPHDFCDQIELFTNKEANTHPKLAKLCTFCCDTRLAAVYDVNFEENITRILSDVLLNDNFGWDDRIKVAIQLAELLVWLHDKGIILGSFTASCIMIEDKEMNIKVFDCGCASDRVNGFSGTTAKCHSGWVAPETGDVTTKSDVYVFALVLAGLITKKERDHSFLYSKHRGKKNMVDENFKEVDPETAFTITSMIYSCTEIEADRRPTMKYVLDVLRTATSAKMGAKVEKRKRDENEAETAATLLA